MEVGRELRSVGQLDGFEGDTNNLEKVNVEIVKAMYSCLYCSFSGEDDLVVLTHEVMCHKEKILYKLSHSTHFKTFLNRYNSSVANRVGSRCKLCCVHLQGRVRACRLWHLSAHIYPHEFSCEYCTFSCPRIWELNYHAHCHRFKGNLENKFSYLKAMDLVMANKPPGCADVKLTRPMEDSFTVLCIRLNHINTSSNVVRDYLVKGNVGDICEDIKSQALELCSQNYTRQKNLKNYNLSIHADGICGVFSHIDSEISRLDVSFICLEAIIGAIEKVDEELNLSNRKSKNREFLKCDLCGVHYDTEIALLTHEVSGHKQELLTNLVNINQFESSQMKTIFKKYYSWSKNSEMTYKKSLPMCKLCGWGRNSFYNRNYNVRIWHLLCHIFPGIIKCNYCTFSSSHMMGMRAHMRVHIRRDDDLFTRFYYSLIAEIIQTDSPRTTGTFSNLYDHYALLCFRLTSMSCSRDYVTLASVAHLLPESVTKQDSIKNGASDNISSLQTQDKEMPSQCYYCFYHNSSQLHVLTHQVIVHGSQISDAIFGGERKRQIKDMFTTSCHLSNLATCGLCGVAVYKWAAAFYTIHLLQHIAPLAGKLQCPFCTLSLDFKQDLDCHVKANHDSYEDKTRYLEAMQNIRRHQENELSPASSLKHPYDCIYCPFSHGSELVVLTHEVIVHVDESLKKALTHFLLQMFRYFSLKHDKEGRMIFAVCKLCGTDVSVSNNINLFTHMKNHLREYTNESCKLCNYTLCTSYYAGMKLHMNQAHRKEDYKYRDAMIYVKALLVTEKQKERSVIEPDVCLNVQEILPQHADNLPKSSSGRNLTNQNYLYISENVKSRAVSTLITQLIATASKKGGDELIVRKRKMTNCYQETPTKKSLSIYTKNETARNNPKACSYCMFEHYDELYTITHEVLFHACHIRKLLVKNNKESIYKLVQRFSYRKYQKGRNVMFCKLCPGATLGLYQLDIIPHLLNHGNLGMFKCSMCTFSADSSDSVTSHSQIHGADSDLPYKRALEYFIAI